MRKSIPSHVSIRKRSTADTDDSLNNNTFDRIDIHPVKLQLQGKSAMDAKLSKLPYLSKMEDKRNFPATNQDEEIGFKCRMLSKSG